MTQHHHAGCSEYENMSRRRFMLGAASVAAAAIVPNWMPRVAFAEHEESSRDVLVSIFLRGGCDGLSMCVPYGDDAYYDARPRLAIARPGGGRRSVTDLDGFFGLSPAMLSLMDAYREGDLLFVHACGSRDETRSHFDAQHYMEVGKPNDPRLTTGWLGRHLMSVAPNDAQAVIRALGISPGLQQSLIGAPKTLPMPDPYEFGLHGNPRTEYRRRRALEEMYAASDEPLRTAAANTERVLDLMNELDLWNYRPGNAAEYPDSEFGHAMQASAGLIAADVGIEAIAVDLDGWDTHSEQGSLDGEMAELMRDLSEGMAAFHADVMAGAGKRVTVVVMSEFGRVVAENGSAGTDHGHGNMMMVMGTGIAGGRVLRKWPGLNREQLFQGQDLEVTIDYRDILAEVIQKRLNNNRIDAVFPDYKPTDFAITRSA